MRSLWMLPLRELRYQCKWGSSTFPSTKRLPSASQLFLSPAADRISVWLQTAYGGLPRPKSGPCQIVVPYGCKDTETLPTHLLVT